MISSKNRGMGLVVLSFMLLFSTLAPGGGQPDGEKIEARINQLLAKMTVEEKVGQMTQLTIQAVAKQQGTIDQPFLLDEKKLRDVLTNYHIGSMLNVYDKALSVEEWQTLITKIQDIATKETRLKIPVLYGIDAIHGANYTAEATLFPQNLAMAATFNRDLVKKSAEITALEMRASGIPWNFNPVLGVGRNPVWPRLFETFGEDPYTVGVLGEAYVLGTQGEDGNYGDPLRGAACMKHYLGYPVPLSGKDRTPAWIPERMLRDIFLPPFKKAVEAGVGTVMVNSGDINGIPSHSDHYLLTRILREELGFDGLVVSDWADINNLYTRDKVAASRREAVKMAVLAGIDMSMVPFDIGFYDELLALVKAGEVPIARIDEAVARILRVKFRANLFEKPYPDPKLKKMVGTPESAATSLEAARQAMTLLKNEGNLLPLDQDSDILLCGPTADLLMVFNGGWSYTWQGNMEGLYPEQKMTLLEAMQDKLGPGRVTYLPGTSYDQAIDIAAAAEAAQGKDVAVIALGEYPYCETPGNINDLTLPAVQLDLVKAVQATGTPVVLVLLQGRPRIITPVVAESEAILMAYLPGNEGGKAIVEVLFGETNPGGRLPVTYPAYPNALTNYDAKWVETDDPNKMSVMWPFGHGLSYTTFAYSGLTVQRKNLSLNPEVEVRVTVTNTGQRAGREIVHLYLSDVVRSVSPQVKQLRGFESLFLKPGESRTVSFTLTQPDFLFHDRHNQPVVEAGQFVLSVGNLESGFELSE